MAGSAEGAEKVEQGVFGRPIRHRVAFVGKLNAARPVDDKRTRPWDLPAIRLVIMPDIVGVNGGQVGIREHGVGQFETLYQLQSRRLVIRADGHEKGAESLKLRVSVPQLRQLFSSGGSPIAPEKDEHRRLRAGGWDSLHLAMPVGQAQHRCQVAW